MTNASQARRRLADNCQGPDAAAVRGKVAASLVWLAVCFSPVRDAPGAARPAARLMRKLCNTPLNWRTPRQPSAPGRRKRWGFSGPIAWKPHSWTGCRDAETSVRRSIVMALAWCGGQGGGDAADRDVGRRRLDRPAIGLGGSDEFDGPGVSLRRVGSGRPTQAAGGAVAAVVGSYSCPIGRRTRCWHCWGRVGWPSLAYGAKVTVSTQYKGEPGDLVDGTTEGGAFWQTKTVPFPQWCQLDLGRPREIAQAVVYQYGPEFCMTDCELAVSLDGEQFDVVTRHQDATPVVWAVRFPYVRPGMCESPVSER